MIQKNKIRFDGYDGVEILTEKLRIVVVTEIGPRIAFLGRRGSDKNILYWSTEKPSRDTWNLYGGHRVWITRPYADESADTYAADNDPCDVQDLDNGIKVTAPVHPFTKLERGMEIRVLSETELAVKNVIKNAGAFIYSGGVWSPTCINPDGKIITIPLGEEESSWDIVTVVTPRVFAGNTVRLDDPQVTYEGSQLVVKPQGQVCKRCVNAPKGEISMLWEEENIRFTKKTRYTRDGKYPFYNCNIAVFNGQDNWMGELETYGTEQAIRPGEYAWNEEIWCVEF